MKKIISLLQPFDAKQIVIAYEDGNKIDARERQQICMLRWKEEQDKSCEASNISSSLASDLQSLWMQNCWEEVEC